MGEWRPVEIGEQGIIGALGSSSAQSVILVPIPACAIVHFSSCLGRLALSVLSASFFQRLTRQQ